MGGRNMSSDSLNGKPQKVLLIDLPVFPKGVVSLGLPVLAAHLKDHAEVELLDLNHFDWNSFSIDPYLDGVDLVGMKVSAQSFHHAKELTERIRRHSSDIRIMWGGELPSLLPDLGLEYADTIVTKRIEACVEEFVADLKKGQLKEKYVGGTDFNGKHVTPSLEFARDSDSYYSFMGLPMETSVGCDRYCRFCMVHTMQPGIKYRPTSHIEEDLAELRGQFVNIVDYNIGMSKEHLMDLCHRLERSDILGWMGEMCLESLEDDEVLEALGRSRCKTIYCGLETLSEEGLKSVNKHKTNHPDNYRRIIRKVQSYGLNVASGFIIGLEGTTEQTFRQMMDFYNEVGIEYVKITFLTYNPGSYFYNAMKRSGSYLTDDLAKFDGNHLTYLADGLEPNELYDGAKRFISEFYALPAIIKRAHNAHSDLDRRMEFIYFNLCYSQAYMSWLEHGVLGADSNAIRHLMEQQFVKSEDMKKSERLLRSVRMRQAKAE